MNPIRTESPMFVAERKLVAEHPMRGRIEFCVRIGQPYPELNGERWACPVSIEDLECPLPDIRGVDSLQALTLAIAAAKSLLQQHSQKGVEFYWPDGQLADVQKIL